MNDRLLRALRCEPVDRTPVWFMRQAGRYLPEYRELRGDRDILETCRDPELAVEITLQPLRRMPLDAAIVFSDIMVPLAAIGIGVRIEPGSGPVVDDPIRSARDLDRLRALEPEADEPYVLETIRLLRKELDTPLVGFAGAPFTLASYLVEGGPSRDHARTKALLHEDPATWGALMERLAEIVRTHLRAQVEAGAQAVQVFDSWVGALDPTDYERSVLPFLRPVFEELGAPAIHFGVGTGELLCLMRTAGGDAIGVDWRVPLDAAWERIGLDRAIQGNLDPAVCTTSWDAVERKAVEVLDRAAMRDGHVFNLGHGVLPDTPVDNLVRLVDLVHERTLEGGMTAPIGVLVMAYGTANGPDDVERYYTDIRGGRPPAPEHLEELKARYAAIGNRFPLLEITREQAASLERELNEGGNETFRAYLGMKHSPPFVAQAVEAMRAEGIERAVGIVMAPHWSGMSVETYIERVSAAGDGPPRFTFVRSYHDHPLFVELLASRVAHALGTLGPAEREGAATIFSAHSLPVRTLEDGSQRCKHCRSCEASCRYRDALQETADLVAKELDLPHHQVAWQSAGRTADAWWGPPIEDVMGELAAQGHPAVVVCSAGFVADHLEILYDLDVEARGIAEEAGIHFARTEMPNTDPAFVKLLATVVREHVDAEGG